MKNLMTNCASKVEVSTEVHWDNGILTSDRGDTNHWGLHIWVRLPTEQMKEHCDMSYVRVHK